MSGGAEADRLRAKIDNGETQDKVKAEDPAVAPLGTDDEAGTPGIAPPNKERK